MFHAIGVCVMLIDVCAGNVSIWLTRRDFNHIGDIAKPTNAKAAVAHLAASPGQPRSAVHSWIFVPTYNRHQDGAKQAMLDWSRAVDGDTAYLRLLVVRSGQEASKYWALVQGMQQQEHKQHQVTALLVMPEEWFIAGFRNTPITADEGGCGYARRLIQQAWSHLSMQQRQALSCGLQISHGSHAWYLARPGCKFGMCCRSSQPLLTAGDKYITGHKFDQCISASMLCTLKLRRPLTPALACMLS